MGTRATVLESGVTLGRRYRLDEHIASGGMSEVWRATDTTLGRRVAVKVLPPSVAADSDFTSRFRAEARLMAALRHPGIADVYDAGESELPTGGQALYLVMEYVDGQPLSRKIAEARRLSPDAVLVLVARAAQALDVAHQHGIVHRDVKPGNLLVTDDGNVVLVDFGVARSATVTAVTSANAVVGTALYMAPEQATGRPVSPATDIYSLGAAAYHCLAGEPPFPGDNPLEVAFKHVHDDPPPLPDDVPGPVRALVERAMSKDPERRYPTAAAFAAAAVGALSPDAADRDSVFSVGTNAFPLLALSAGFGGPGPGTSDDLEPVEATGPERRRRPVRLLIGAGAAVLLLATLTAMAMMLRPTSANSTQRLEPAPATQPTTSARPSAATTSSGGGLSGAGNGIPARNLPSGPPASASPSGTVSTSPSTGPANSPTGQPTAEPTPTPTDTVPTGVPPTTEPAATPTDTSPPPG